MCSVPAANGIRFSPSSRRSTIPRGATLSVFVLNVVAVSAEVASIQPPHKETQMFLQRAVHRDHRSAMNTNGRST